MAKQIIQNPSITLNGTAMQANISQVTINLTAEDVDMTNFGSLGWKERTGGLRGGGTGLPDVPAARHVDPVRHPAGVDGDRIIVEPEVLRNARRHRVLPG
jgi:hypothetical protein